MRARPTSSVAIGFALALGAIATLAFGETDAEPVKIELKAHDGCPDSDAFYDAMRTQTKKIRRPNVGDKPRVFKITIKKVGTKSAGELILPDKNKKTITGATCQEVVDELAFAAAESVDPHAGETEPEATASASASVEPSASVSAAPPKATPASDSPGRLRLSAGVGIEALAAQSPGVVVATPLYVDGAWERADVLSPSFRLSYLHATGGLIETVEGVARFRWNAVQLDACPLRFGTSGLRLRPCAGFEAGKLEGSPGENLTAARVSRTWLAARVMGRFDWILFDTLVLSAHVGLALPFTRDAFTFSPTTTIYKPPAVLPFFGASFGFRLP